MEILGVHNIVKQYAGHRALDNISISTKKGEIFGLLGPNGAGKTSLIRIINQITGPDSGQILLNGNPITREDISKIVKMKNRIEEMNVEDLVNKYDVKNYVI